MIHSLMEAFGGYSGLAISFGLCNSYPTSVGLYSAAGGFLKDLGFVSLVFSDKFVPSGTNKPGSG